MNDLEKPVIIGVIRDAASKQTYLEKKKNDILYKNEELKTSLKRINEELKTNERTMISFFEQNKEKIKIAFSDFCDTKIEENDSESKKAKTYDCLYYEMEDTTYISVSHKSGYRNNRYHITFKKEIVKPEPYSYSKYLQNQSRKELYENAKEEYYKNAKKEEKKYKTIMDTSVIEH